MEKLLNNARNIELFPHNQSAYEKAVEKFKSHNRTCIIHPTGTGKAVIIAKFMVDQREKRHLLLAPGRHIMSEIKKHNRTVPFHFYTYASLKTKARVESLKGFDYIYLDEFHRLGADIWGGGVEYLLKLNPDVKILGTSATPIRYLDDQRNMAMELFDQNIASEMSLNRAIAEGILPSPKYISALYSVEEEVEKIEYRIASSNRTDKRQLQDKIRADIIDWERSRGLDVIIKKHLPVDRNRIIVFCRDGEHLKLAEKTLANIFKEIFGTVRCLQIYSKQKRADNNLSLAVFQSSDNIPTILFTIDMVNEGLHSKNCNTVFLLRETTSPIVFYQQIGRAFSINQEGHPIIFDLVNNFKSLQLEAFKEDYERELFLSKSAPDRIGNISGPKSAIEFIDETQDLRALLDSISSFFNPWDENFRQARAFYSENGHLSIPTNVGGLSMWLNGQRYLEKNGLLPSERFLALSTIGMNWEYGIPGVWMDRFGELVDFIKRHGKEPGMGTNNSLSLWLYWQRRNYKEGKLKPDQIKILNTVVQLEDHKKVRDLKERVRRLVQYFTNSKEFTSKDSIYKDISAIRYQFNRGILPDQYYKELLKVGVPFEVKDDFWERRYAELQQWCEEVGTLPASSTNSNLYNWYNKQLTAIRNGELTDECSKLICKVQSQYKKFDQWEDSFQQVKKHIDTFKITGTKSRNLKLLRWVYKQRREILNNKLSVEKRTRLLSLEGIDWRPAADRKGGDLTDIFGRLYEKKGGVKSKLLYGTVCS